MNGNSQRPEQDQQHSEADLILETALVMAGEETGWYDLSLVELARRCGISVNDVRRHYEDSNAIADAWFARALAAMLEPLPAQAGPWAVKERLEFIVWRWFAALAPHHRVTAQMLGSKLHPPHVHHWVPMVFDLSRLVQFWRDAAGLHAGGRRRQLEEIALTGIFLATLREWCLDRSPQQAHTRSRLAERLSRAERAAGYWFPTENRGSPPGYRR